MQRLNLRNRRDDGADTEGKDEQRRGQQASQGSPLAEPEVAVDVETAV